MKGRAPCRFAAIMRAEPALDQPEAALQRLRRGAEGIRYSALEPANRARAYPRHHDSRIPCRAQRAVEPVKPPYREQIRRAPAAHVNHILFEQESAQVGNPPVEEPQMSCARPLRREGAMEQRDVGIAVAARRPDKADSRIPLRARQRQREVIQQRIVEFHRKSAAAHRDDMPLRHPPPLNRFRLYGAVVAKRTYLLPRITQLEQHLLGMLPVF